MSCFSGLPHPPDADTCKGAMSEVEVLARFDCSPQTLEHLLFREALPLPFLRRADGAYFWRAFEIEKAYYTYRVLTHFLTTPPSDARIPW